MKLIYCSGFVVLLCAVVARRKLSVATIKKHWRERTLRLVVKSRYKSPDTRKIMTDYYQKHRNENPHPFKDPSYWENVKLIGKMAHYFRLYKRFGEAPGDDYPGELLRFKFPDTIIKSPSKLLVNACSNSLPKCLQFIDENLVSKIDYYKPSSKNLRKFTIDLNGFRFNGLGRFKGIYEMYNFMIVVSYYMCWYTMLELPIMKYLPFCDYEDSWDQKFNKNDSELEDMDEVSFRCAKLSFCPDPCCGRRSVTRTESCIVKGHKHPCEDMTIPHACSLPGELNLDFKKLITNMFTHECNCGHVGFIYNMKLGLCIDFDECLDGDGEVICQQYANHVCVNTVGSFVCACRYGTKLVPGGSCVRFDPPHYKKSEL